MAAVLAAPPELTSLHLTSLGQVVDALELRADLTGDPDPRLLRRHFTGTLIYRLPTPPNVGVAPMDPHGMPGCWVPPPTTT